MYDIALSVWACVRSGTRADVVWMVAPTASDEALAFTPGGGRIGSLASGAFDGALADVAARNLSAGRLVTHSVSELESAMSGLPTGSSASFLVLPADQLPTDLWPRLLERDRVAITAMIDGDVVTDVVVVGADESDGTVRDLLAAGQPAVEIADDRVITVLAPVRRLVIAGQGPIAQALARQGELLGWKVVLESRPDLVAGLAATLSWLDAIVVMGHDVEPSSRCLMSALESDAGYIGALGSATMQQARADWLAYRDVTDLSRVNGPAGLAIGARTPAEIAVSIVSQIIGQSDSA